MEVKRKQMEEMRKKRLMVSGLKKGPEKDEEVFGETDALKAYAQLALV